MNELSKGTFLKEGKYRIESVLGQGAFGITYLATAKLTVSENLGSMNVSVKVAIKEFFMSDLNSRSADGSSVEQTNSSLVKNYRQKFRREAENLSKLQHPNIVKVLEVFDENNTAYYAMEFIEGDTLDDYIKKKGRLPEAEALEITQEVCSALSYMHEHKMLHLDLKPKNIMRNSEGHIFLIDFGLAKQYTEDGEPESSTSLGLGTPGYAPIEQANYKKDGSFPVTLDIYALGASLYKMLTGKTPPDSSHILNDGLPLSQLKSAGVSEGTIAIVEKAMAPMRKERYQSVKALAFALGNSSEDEVGTTIQESEEGTAIQGAEEGTSDEEHTEYPKDEEEKSTPKNEKKDSEEKEEPSFIKKYWKHGIVVAALLFQVCILFFWNSSSSTSQYDEVLDTLVVDAVGSATSVASIGADTVVADIVVSTPKTKKIEDNKAKKESKAEQTQSALKTPAKSSNNRAQQEQNNAGSLSADVNQEPNETDSEYSVVEEMPSFPGGDSGLMTYLNQNVKYPFVAAENGIQGKVIVSFVVERDGSISNVKVVRSVDPSLDAEAVRVIKNMPQWNPGKHKGAAVRVKYTMPITFRL